MFGATDTIFAVASGAGRAAITVMRITGPRSGELLAGLCRRRPPARMASLRTLRDENNDILDRALVLWQPGPGSYSGEDSAELHLHGGVAVVDGVAGALARGGARPAEPGEFSRRAFLNGRMDLLEAEAVADLVEAETEAQRRQALRQLGGELGSLYRGWTERLTGLLARQEALIDFPNEDLPPTVEAALLAEIVAIRGEILAHLGDGRRGERLREGLVVAITGPPNVGKSTLINALSGRDAAIVSPRAGTTRDVLEVRMAIAGVPITIVDTAGLRETDDPVEAEGVRRARARVSTADLVLALRDTDDEPVPPGSVSITTKADLGVAVAEGSLGISALTGSGMEALRERLAREVTKLARGAGPPALTRARHRAGLREAANGLDEALRAGLPELRGEALRQAARGIGRVTGRVGTDAVLDAIFRQFCIGK